MYVTPEQIQASTKANMDAILSLAASQFAAFEKFASLNANAVKTAFEDSIANARKLLADDDRDPRPDGFGQSLDVGDADFGIGLAVCHAETHPSGGEGHGVTTLLRFALDRQDVWSPVQEPELVDRVVGMDGAVLDDERFEVVRLLHDRGQAIGPLVDRSLCRS